MSDEARRVLDLLAQGKVTVDEAYQLLDALKKSSSGGSARATSATRDGAAPRTGTEQQAARPRYLRINVRKAGKDGRPEKDVNIRVPFAIVRGGMRLGTFIPGFSDHMNARLRARGVDLDLSKVDGATLESLLTEFGQLTIDVNQGDKQVRISCE